MLYKVSHIFCIAAGGEAMRKWLRRVSGEHATLSGSLPVAWTSSVLLAADASRLDVIRSSLGLDFVRLDFSMAALNACKRRMLCMSAL